jgi:soluble lytic murein transglycosylase
VAAYKRFIDRFPDAPDPERPYLNIIDALHEAGRYKEALDWVLQTRTRFRDLVGAPLALFAQTRIHAAQGLWQAVIADTNELQKFPDLGGTRVPGGSSQSEVRFQHGYALEQVGNFPQAVEAYLAIPDGRNEYYGQRATQRLRALAVDAKTRNLIQDQAESARAATGKAIERGDWDDARRLAEGALRLTADSAPKDELLQLLRRAYDSLPAYKLPSFKSLSLGRQEIVSNAPEETSEDPTHARIADELFFLGLLDEGAPEFAAAQSKSTITTAAKQPGPAAPTKERAHSPSDIDYTLALYFLRGGLANRAVSFAEQVWKPIPGDYVLDLAPREMVEFLYPISYRESLLRHAPAKGVDPRFVLSIARQESRFQSDAKSVAAARGLMQFISATVNEVAGQLGRRDFPQDQLYNPDTAILFGSQYLSTLFKQFPGQPQAVAASYNGGPDNVARWIARSRSDEPDRYVAEIGFSQTKDYVFKVMTNFWVYQQLYDAQLQRLLVRS